MKVSHVIGRAMNGTSSVASSQDPAPGMQNPTPFMQMGFFSAYLLE